MAVRMVGPMSWLVIPALLTILATVVLSAPIRIFGLALPQPVWPMVLAFAWPLIRPSMAGAAAVFGLGLFLDLFWGGVLGMWPLALMLVYGLTLLGRNLLAGQQTLFLFAVYAGVVTAAFLSAHLVVSVATGTIPSLWATLGQWGPTLVLFPLANGMVQRFDDGDVRFR